MYVMVPAPALTPAREQQQRLMAEGRELCPWCDGTGERRRGYDDRVPCAPCEGTGEADRWVGEAADDWRRRRDADAAWRREHLEFIPAPDVASENEEQP